MLALGSFFLIYASAFAGAEPTHAFRAIPERAPGHEESELPVIAAFAAYLVTTVLIAAPILLVRRGQGEQPVGTATLIVGTVALLSVVVIGLPAAQLGGALGATLGALVFDLATSKTRLKLLPAPGTGALIAALVWSGELSGLAAVDALRWPVSLWTGVVVLSSLVGAGLGSLARSERT